MYVNLIKDKYIAILMRLRNQSQRGSSILVVKRLVRAHLHQRSPSTLRQLCDDASDIVLIQNNGVASKWVATPFWSDSIDSNESRITSVIATLLLMLSVNGPLQELTNVF